MRENKKPSEIWIVNLESQNLTKQVVKNCSSQLAGTYKPGQEEPILFPIGYIIKHDDDYTSGYKVYDKGFEKKADVVVRPIYDSSDVSHLEGELLTVIDASFADKSQREAIKSLVRTTIWRFNHRKEEEVEEVFKASR